MTDSQAPEAAKEHYRVLARKYRPSTFGELVGQEALVRTLTNALASNRIAQAYMLTGVRGVGKTTTARLIAKALNCIGPDGQGGPTITPCDVCEHCLAITGDRHVDVQELDAASRTGVDDMRELIEGVRYRPTMARYKIYIIDEVHMLSNHAFNALLKTLEEPPEHVKFIFATTEIRKVPITVLSRCQRFDLRRVEGAELAKHFAAIAVREGAEIEEGALALIARAADGSVRDGLSLLDQAIVHGEGKVTAEQVSDMLGLADRTVVLDLFDRLMRGEVAGALDALTDQYRAGADPAVVIQDMLGLTHWLTKAKAVPETMDDPAVAEAERTRGREMVEKLSMASLTRCWQMLLKALTETRNAPNPLQAAEMALVRIAYAADLPSPAEAVESLKSEGPRPPSGRPAAPSSSPSALSHSPTPPPGPSGGPQAMLAPQGQPAPAGPRTFEEVVSLFREKREAIMVAHLTEHVHLVSFKPGRIEFRPGPAAPSDLANRLSRMLTQWTDTRWVATVSNAAGEQTIRERERTEVEAHPVVKAVLETFPGSTIKAITRRQAEIPAPVDPVEIEETEE